MHPELGGNAHSPPQSKAPGAADDAATTPLPVPRSNPTSFFVASEADLDNRERANSAGSAVKDSTYGIRSIDETTSKDEDVEDKEEQEVANPRDKYRRRSTIRPQDIVLREQSTDSLLRNPSVGSTGSSPRRHGEAKNTMQLDSLSQPLTPVSYSSPILSSEVPSSPKSFDERSLRIGDEDELGDAESQAIISDDEDDDAPPVETTHGEGMQLIMPSILMPTRRPFTSRGKQVGKVKVVLAGPSGVGKTSLIKSIVQVCEDIVHVDPIPSTSSRRPHPSKARSRPGAANSAPTRKVTEIQASTKPYPQWWSELEENDTSLKRRITNEDMLERNVCFVDTPGYDNGNSVLQGMKTTLDYVESQMARSSMIGELKESELLSMLSGNGGLHVDLVIYLISHDLKAADIEYLRQLSHLAPTIPVLAKSDTFSPDSLVDLKPAILEQLRQANVIPFAFPSQSPLDLPYAVCSSTSSELESMDASLLMQSDILPPLTPSDLPHLLNDLFTPLNLSALKHASARKLLRWRSNPRASPLPAPLTTALAPSPSLVPSTSSPSTLSLTAKPQAFSALTHPRLAVHTQREERLANIRLANWAGQLQRSLAAERARYEEMARREREGWLRTELEKYKDVDIDSKTIQVDREGQLVTVHNSSSRSSRSRSTDGDSTVRHRKNVSSTSMLRYASDGRRMDEVDPLGILRLGESLSFGGWMVLRVMGGCSLVGGLAVLVARMSGYGVNFWPVWIANRNESA